MNELVAQDSKPRDPIMVLRDQLEARAPEFASFLPSTLPIARFKNVVMTAVTNNPDLLGADRVTFFNSCRKAALDGLAPDGKEAALVIYRTKKKNERGQDVWINAVQYLPMKEGLRKKVRNSGKIKDLQSEVIRQRDHFRYGLLDGETRFEWQPYLGTEDPGPVIAAFSVATFLDGEKSYKVMSIRDIERIRLQSSKQKTETGEPTSAWKNYYPEMCCKTVIKRHCSELPQSTDLDDLVRDPKMEFEEADEQERKQAARPKLSDFTGGGSQPIFADVSPTAALPAAEREAEEPEAQPEPDKAAAAQQRPAQAAAGKGKRAAPAHDPDTGEIEEADEGGGMTPDAAAALGETARRNNRAKRPPEAFREGGAHAALASHWLRGWDKADAEISSANKEAEG